MKPKMKRIWVNKADSYKDAEKFDVDYYLNMDTTTRLETIQILREIYFKINKGFEGENRKRLRRFIKILQQK